MNSDYTTSIVLDSNRSKQLIYTGQLYGTFFSVFGTFEFSSSGKTKSLSKVTLDMMNYKGVVNIGIVQAKFIKTPSIIDPIVNFVELQMELKGFKNPKERVEVQKVLDIDPIDNNTWLYVNRVLHKLDSNEAVFDEEFHYRDGHFKYDIKKSEIDREARSFAFREMGIKNKIPPTDSKSEKLQEEYNFDGINESTSNKKGVTPICVIGMAKFIL